MPRIWSTKLSKPTILNEWLHRRNFFLLRKYSPGLSLRLHDLIIINQLFSKFKTIFQRKRFMHTIVRSPWLFNKAIVSLKNYAGVSLCMKKINFGIIKLFCITEHRQNALQKKWFWKSSTWKSLNHCVRLLRNCKLG